MVYNLRIIFKRTRRSGNACWRMARKRYGFASPPPRICSEGAAEDQTPADFSAPTYSDTRHHQAVSFPRTYSTAAGGLGMARSHVISRACARLGVFLVKLNATRDPLGVATLRRPACWLAVTCERDEALSQTRAWHAMQQFKSEPGKSNKHSLPTSHVAPFR